MLRKPEKPRLAHDHPSRPAHRRESDQSESKSRQRRQVFAGVQMRPFHSLSRNRDRLLEAVMRRKKVHQFLSDDHSSVDGTLVEAWASMKSVRSKDGLDEPPGPGRHAQADFHGAPSGLCHEPAPAQAGRRGVRLDQDHPRARQGEAARSAAHPLPVHLRHGRLQPDPDAEAAGGYVRCKSRERSNNGSAHPSQRQHTDVKSATREQTCLPRQSSTAC